MLGYQRHIWNADTLKALLSKVPNDHMLILDLAADYNKTFWRNGMNRDVFHGFFRKPWIYSVVPNMGGKCAMTGVLDFYANGHLEAHPTWKLSRWLTLARSHGTSPNEQDSYEKNARRLVTRWGLRWMTMPLKYGAD